MKAKRVLDMNLGLWEIITELKDEVKRLQETVSRYQSEQTQLVAEKLELERNMGLMLAKLNVESESKPKKTKRAKKKKEEDNLPF